MPQTAQTGLCDVVLYSGMGMIMVGSVITVVGLGDKGFHSLELSLMGPIIVGCGLVMASVRILVCILPGMQMGKMWGGWGKVAEGDKEKLIDGGDRLKPRTVNPGRRMVGTPLLRSKYFKCQRTRFMREGDLVSMIGYHNDRNFMKMPPQIV